MPGNFVGRLAVENQSEWSLTLPHPPGDVIAAAQFVGETLAVLVKEHSADATQGLSSQKLDLGIRLIRVHQAGRVDLHPLQIHCVASHAHSHLNAITSAVLTVGGRQVGQIRSVGLQDRVGSEISTEPSCGEDHRAIRLALLPILSLVLHPSHRTIRTSDQLGHGGLLQNLCPIRALLHFLKLLDESIGDRHARELLATSVGSRLRVATQSSEQRQI
mmetsp:Transcript_39680/g.86628  ORF Transcript_39680/g.86628 Transcript_39680/m.86628 type:complete len:217 (-) Transcript_39680:359-1009(-)